MCIMVHSYGVRRFVLKEDQFKFQRVEKWHDWLESYGHPTYVEFILDMKPLLRDAKRVLLLNITGIKGVG